MHALEDDDHHEWYPRYRHRGEGNAYKFNADDGELDDTYAQQVAAATCPAYPEASDAAERRAVRSKDKRARLCSLTQA